jgi:hypothetical protein
MVLTRSKASKSNEASPGGEITTKKRASNKTTQPAKRAKTASNNSSTTTPTKQRKNKSHEGPKDTDEGQGDPTTQLDKCLKAYQGFPALDGLKKPQSATSETVLAHLLHALISSARISHSIAERTVNKLISAHYHDIDTLERSSWEERTVVLTDGGYTHYREKTATTLGELVTLLRTKYDGDASRLLDVQGVKDSKATVLKRAKEVKGIGDLGAEVFLETVQSVAPQIAPAMSKRNVEVAEKLNLGEPEAIYNEMKRDPLSMAKLCQVLTTVRLQGNLSDFKTA